MSSFTSKATSSLARYRPAILALTIIAAGCTIYAVSKNLSLFPASGIGTSQPSGGPLHRSNAQRRRCLRRRRPIATGTEPQTEAAPEIGVVISYGQKYNDGKRVFGTFQYTNAATGKTHLVWLAPHQLPSIQYIQEEWNITAEEASSLRWHMEIKFLDSFFAQEMPPEPPIPLTEHVKEGFSIEFAAAAQIPPLLVSCAIERYEMGNLQDHPARSAQGIDSNSPRPTQLSISSSDGVSTGTSGDLSAVFSIFHDPVIVEARNGGHHIAETESIQSNGAGDDQNKPPDNQNLMNLCYRIAEDQAKRESFVHRGINCNSCNAMPIRGIRYRCSNCPDYDLCEQCENMQIHDKTHIFYKVRIPAPLQSNPRKSAPVWYPGNPNNVGRNLNRELQKTLSTKTGIPERQVDAVWEQFQCLASADFLDDPYGFGIAINRRDFDKSFIPSAAPGFSPANLIYDQTFSFYDTNNDGLIDFEELLHGIACIRNEGSKLREKIFQSYDLDADGFVTRKDFLRMFRAYYSLTKELTAQVISGIDDEYFDEADARGVIGSSQPISSIFCGPIPSGDPSDSGLEKLMSPDAEMHVVDGQGFILADDTTDHDPGSEVHYESDVIAQVTQEAMNELLDPMFKLREVIAVGIKKTQEERHLYKHVIDHLMRDGYNLDRAIMEAFGFYEKRWYQELSVIESDTSLGDQVEAFIIRAVGYPQRLQDVCSEAITNTNLVGGEEKPGQVSDTADFDASIDYPEPAVELQQGVTTFDGDASTEEYKKDKPLELLLADAGYGVATPPLQDFDWSSESSISLPDQEEYRDPTMPQHRPNSFEEWRTRYGRSDVPVNNAASQESYHTPIETESMHQLSPEKLLSLKIWSVFEEDDRKRGGPGRLDLTDFTHIMEGDKGEGFGFVGSWIETVRAF